jgi:hypothetical protein
MSKPKLKEGSALLLYLIAGLICLNLILIGSVHHLLTENMICNEAKEDKIFIYLKCLKNKGSE